MNAYKLQLEIYKRATGQDAPFPPPSIWESESLGGATPIYKCSRCESLATKKSPFCPQCGAPMKNYEEGETY